MEAKETLHVALMHKAYAMFRKHDEWTLNDFYFNISPLERRAVALGNLNYQVGNGGFMQWINNGYAEESGNSIRLIANEITGNKKFPSLSKALTLAQIAMGYERYNHDDNEDEVEQLDKLDSQFYALVKLENEMDDYLATIKLLES